MNEELKKAVALGNKRMAIACTIWNTIFAIPLLFTVNSKYFIYYFYCWLAIVMIGVFLSPKFVGYIWKNS